MNVKILKNHIQTNNIILIFDSIVCYSYDLIFERIFKPFS
jgi:hypothetical protein